MLQLESRLSLGATYPLFEQSGMNIATREIRNASTKTLCIPLTTPVTALNAGYDFQFNFDVISAIALVADGDSSDWTPALRVRTSPESTLSMEFEGLGGGVWRLQHGLEKGDLSTIHFAHCDKFFPECAVDLGSAVKGSTEGSGGKVLGQLVLHGAVLGYPKRAELVTCLLREEKENAGSVSKWRILEKGKALDVPSTGRPLVVVPSEDFSLSEQVTADTLQFPATFTKPFLVWYGCWPRLCITPAVARCVRAGAFGKYNPETDACMLHLGCSHTFPVGRLTGADKVDY